jgi:hypothetical protein
MLRPIRAALSGAFALALVAAAAATMAAQPAERELLGVRIWRDYGAVLKRHGEPTRVVPGMAMPPDNMGGSVSVGMQGGMSGPMGMAGGPMTGPMMGGMGMMGGPPSAPMMGGIAGPGGIGAPGMRGGTSMGMPMMGGRSMPGGAMGGMMGRGGPGGGKDEDMDDIGRGGPIGGASAPGPGGFAGPPRMGQGMSAPPGMSAPQYGASGGMSAMGGLMMGPGMMGGMMGSPGMGSTGQVSAQSQTPVSIPSEEVKETWVYVRGAQTFHFMFNRDGRVIRIQSFGTKGTGATSRAISLGDPLAKVYKAYGWAGTTQKMGASLTLDYSQKAHVVFDLLDRNDRKGPRVVGITIAPSEGRR